MSLRGTLFEHALSLRRGIKYTAADDGPWLSGMVSICMLVRLIYAYVNIDRDVYSIRDMFECYVSGGLDVDTTMVKVNDKYRDMSIISKNVLHFTDYKRPDYSLHRDVSEMFYKGILEDDCIYRDCSEFLLSKDNRWISLIKLFHSDKRALVLVANIDSTPKESYYAATLFRNYCFEMLSLSELYYILPGGKTCWNFLGFRESPVILPDFVVEDLKNNYKKVRCLGRASKLGLDRFYGAEDNS